MKHTFLLLTFFLSLACFAQPRKLLAPKGEILNDTVTSLNVQAPLTKVNDSTIGFNYSDTTAKWANNLKRSSDSVYIRIGSTWYFVFKDSTGGAGISGWGLTGNTGTNAATNWIGTSDGQDFVLKSNGIIRAIFKSDGSVWLDSLYIGRSLRYQKDNTLIGSRLFNGFTGYNSTIVSQTYPSTPVTNSAYFGEGLIYGTNSNYHAVFGYNSGGTAACTQCTIFGSGSKWGSGGSNITAIGSGIGGQFTSPSTIFVAGLNSLFNATNPNSTIAIGDFAGAYTSRYPTNTTWTTNADPMQRCDTCIIIGHWARPKADSQSNQIIIAAQRGLGLGTNSTVLGNYNTRISGIGGRTALNANAQRFNTGTEGSLFLTTAYAMAEPAAGASLDVKGTEGGFLPPRMTQAQRDALPLGAPVKSIKIDNRGGGYLSGGNGTIEMTFSGGGGSGLQAAALVNGGIIQSVIVYSWGNGYTSAPTVSSLGSNTTPAAFTVEIEDVKGLTVYCTDCISTSGRTGVYQTWDGQWNNHY